MTPRSVCANMTAASDAKIRTYNPTILTMAISLYPHAAPTLDANRGGSLEIRESKGS